MSRHRRQQLKRQRRGNSASLTDDIRYLLRYGRGRYPGGAVHHDRPYRGSVLVDEEGGS